MTRFIGDIGLTRSSSGGMIDAPVYRGDFASPAFYFDYYRRGLDSSLDPCSWKSLWPTSRSMSGDFSTGYSLGDDMWQTSYMPWARGYAGARGGKFILGRVKDAGGNGIPGVVVQAFRTSDDLFVEEVTTDNSGYYCVGTPYEGVAHYLVAYEDSGSDRMGTTVNTLIPTNIDGT